MAFLCFILTLSNAYAQSKSSLEFELLVFYRNTLQAWHEERWPQSKPLAYHQGWCRLQAVPSSDWKKKKAGSDLPFYQSLPASTYQLNDLANQIEVHHAGKVLFHDRWRQPIDHTHPTTIYLNHAQADNALSKPAWQITGSLTTIQPYQPIDCDVRLRFCTTAMCIGMHQYRRIKRHQIHYFDHPLFGVLLLVH